MVTQTDDTVELNLERKINDSYKIVIGTDLFPRIARELRDELSGKVSKFAIITDSNVGPLYARFLETHLRMAGLDCMTFGFMAGEANKNLDTHKELLIQLAQQKFGRDSAIIALGGGVTGDLGGYVAASHCRGVRLIQIATTTLAQADSSIGGKVGVDVDDVKNGAGDFKQPWRDYMDMNTLDTLDDRNYRAGLVEVVKHGIIQDAKFFEYLEENMDKLLAHDKDALMYIARQNSRIKGNVVEQDPEERMGLRMILNLGHTLGHAIESASGYKLLHGEAVALGIRAVLYIAERVTDFPNRDSERVNNLLDRLAMPAKIALSMTDEEIIAITLSDKKAKGGRARYCLPLAIGTMHPFDNVYATYVEKEIVVAAINKLR